MTKSEVVLNKKYLAMLKTLNLYLNHFPKHEKYALSNRIRNTAYEVFDLMTEGQKRYFKKTTLQNLDIKHQQLRMQIYLANELSYFNYEDGLTCKEDFKNRFLKITKLIDEVGKMIGAWISITKDQARK